MKPATSVRSSVPRRGRGGASRLATVAIGVVVVGTGLAFAVPRFLGDDEPLEVLAPVQPDVVVAAPAAPEKVAPAVPVAAAPSSSEDGDLVLELKLRWDSVACGASLPATVRVGNTGLAPFQLPAAGEPHPSLALVVLDGEGCEVRRVVETGPDPYPRRTVTVKPGTHVDLQALVLSGDDAPLPAGTYTVYAEMRRDPHWQRLGLPMWTAPHGPVRSVQVPLTVAAKPD